MKIILKLFIILFHLNSISCENDSFENILISVNESKGKEVILDLCARDYSFSATDYVCAYLTLNESQFYAYIKMANDKDKLIGLWNVDKYTYSNSKLKNLKDIAINGSYVNRIIKKLVIVTQKEPKERCLALSAAYRNSDGYFRSDFFELLVDARKQKSIDDCLKENSPEFMADLKELG